MISAPIAGSCSRAKASSRPRVPPRSPTISCHHRVVNIHSCSLSPAWPNGASWLCGSPVPKPSSEIEKLWTRTSDTADLLQGSGFIFTDLASGMSTLTEAAPMSHRGGRIPWAPGGPVDPDHFPDRLLRADSTGRRNSAREHSYLVITRDVFSLTA